MNVVSTAVSAYLDRFRSDAATPEVRWRESVLLLLVPLVGMWLPSFGVLYVLLGRPETILFPSAMAGALAATPFVLRATRSLRIAASLVLGTMLATAAGVALSLGQLAEPILLSTMGIPLAAFFLGGLRFGMAWLAIVLGVAWTMMGFAIQETRVLTLDELRGERLLACVVFPAVTTIQVLVAWSFEKIRAGMLRALDAERVRARDAHREVRTILAALQEGLLLVDAEGRASGEHSAVAETLLGPIAAGRPLWELIAPHDPDAGAWLELAWPILHDPLCSVDIAFGQLPTKVSLRGRAHRLAYRPVLEGEALVGVVVCVQDASAEETIESMLRGQRELFRLATRAVRDPAGLREFLEEGRRLLADLRDGRAGPADQLGLLHTLKGNAALLGLERVGELCHALETRAETGPLRAEDLEPLVAAWSELDQRARSMLGRQRATLEVSRADRDALLAAIAEGAPPDALRSLVEAWDLEPVERRFERLADQARTLASRLGRGPLEVEIAARGVRLPAEGFAEFWSALAHIVRNAVDHGIEPAPERLRLGKPHRGRLRFEAEKLGGDRVLITLTDDGRGVDWAALRRKAQRRGQTPDLPRSELFFLGGLSSRDEVSLSSGRGVGTSAVARVVDALGGRCQVWSATGEGTTLEFVLPVHRPAAAPDAPSELGR